MGELDAVDLTRLAQGLRPVILIRWTKIYAFICMCMYGYTYRANLISDDVTSKPWRSSGLNVCCSKKVGGSYSRLTGRFDSE